MFIYVPVHFNLRHRGSCSLVQCLCSATRREQRFNLVRHASVHGALPSGGLVLGSVAGVAVEEESSGTERHWREVPSSSMSIQVEF
jgi:hypothetical protein